MNCELEGGEGARRPSCYLSLAIVFWSSGCKHNWLRINPVNYFKSLLNNLKVIKNRFGQYEGGMSLMDGHNYNSISVELMTTNTLREFH